MAAVAPQMEHAPVPSFQYTTASSWQRVRHRDEEEDDDDDEDEDDGVLSTSYCDRQPPYSDFDLVNTVTHEFKKFCDSKASDMLMKDGVRISRRGLM